MINVSARTSVNNTSSSYTPYPVPSRVEGITVSVFFLLEAVLISAGNSLTISLFAKEKKLRKKSLLVVVNMAFADLISGAVCLPLYVFLSIGPMYRQWKSDTSYKTLRIGWNVVDTTFSKASLISAVCIACERFYAIFRPLKHRTSITQSVLRCNCYHLDAGYACFRGVQYSKILNFKHSSYLCLDVIPFAVSIYCLFL